MSVSHAAISAAVDEWVCPACGKDFDNMKSLQVHRASHQMRECRHCGQPFSIRGLDRHEAFCAKAPATGIDSVLPLHVWQGRVRDFLEHAVEIPRGSVLIVTEDFGPAFTSPQHAARRVIEACETIVVVPASACGELSGTARRWRRFGRSEHDAVPVMVAPAEDRWALPGLGGE